MQKQKFLSVKQKNSPSMHHMSIYFEKTKWVIREKRIIEFDSIQNMNKIEFRIGCGKAQLIVTMNPNKLFRMIDLKNCNYITLVEYIGFANEIIPFILLVFKDKIFHM